MAASSTTQESSKVGNAGLLALQARSTMALAKPQACCILATANSTEGINNFLDAPYLCLYTSNCEGKIS
jgi:hypothetical protein